MNDDALVKKGTDMSIEDLGWNAYFSAIWNAEDRTGCVPARVVAQQRGLWRVAGDSPECWAAPSGKLRDESGSGGNWPVAGDWVAAELCTAGAPAIIQAILERRTKFSRKEAGKRVSEQVIAANVDRAIIVAALDHDFNLRRIERYVAQCWESGASPAIVLNKADACETKHEYIDEVANISVGAPVFVLSAKTGDGVGELEATFVRGQTVVFLGSSGVGKSTLLNRLMGEDRQATQAVRAKDSRGRHTTTAHELLTLPCGAMVIDTPGLRELQLWDAGEGISRAFADIEELATHCRFRDCRHESEPGCAVLAALEEGSLDVRRLDNMRKLEREQEFLMRKMDPEKQHEYKNRIKISFRAIRQDAQSRQKPKN